MSIIKSKYLKQLIYIICLFVIFVGFTNYIANAVDFAGGNGTKENPYLIKTAEQLNEVRFHLDKHFKQIDFIDLSIYSNWEPIGNNKFQNKFRGTYDGNGHKIKNINISEDKKNYLGLFGYCKNANLKNIPLQNINIKGDSQIGGVVGKCENTTIRDVSLIDIDIEGIRNLGGLVGKSVSSEIIHANIENIKIKGDSRIGGLIGENNESNILSSSVKSSDNTIDGNRNKIGGLVGSNKGKIKNSGASINVEGDNEVGGLVGENRGNIINCYSMGDVSSNMFISSSKTKTGGLIGGNYSGNIINCKALGDVLGSKGQVGGLIGYNTNNLIEKSYAIGVVKSGDRDVGGLIGYNGNNKIIQCYSIGDVKMTKKYRTSVNNIGGLIGHNEKKENEITDCYSVGRVLGYGKYIGGLIGYNRNKLVKNTYASGKIKFTGDNIRIGGLIGLNEEGKIKYSYYDKDTTGQYDAGKGRPKTLIEMTKKETFQEWDFENIWEIKEGTYPYFQWQEDNFPTKDKGI